MMSDRNKGDGIAYGGRQPHHVGPHFPSKCPIFLAFWHVAMLLAR